MWCVYVLKLKRPSPYRNSVHHRFGGKHYYVGCSSNLIHRLKAHRAGNGSTITRECGVKEVCAVYTVASKSEAEKLEKKLSDLCAQGKPF